MPRPERILFVCTNTRPADHKESCAGHNGADALAQALKDEVRRRGVKREVRIVRTTCLGVCNGGPHAVVQPDNVWYAGACPADAVELVEEQLLGGRPVERLRAPEPSDPLPGPATGEESS